MSKTTVIEDISNPTVLKYYTEAASIAEKALTEAIKLCVDGASAYNITKTVDDMILAETSSLYKTDKKMTKGIAYPTSLAVNNVIGNVSPYAEDPLTLKTGDVVKIDLGVQVGGYPIMVAHTVVVDTPIVSGEKADLLVAAYNACQVAARMLCSEASGEDVTKAINSIATDFGVHTVPGVLSHSLSKNTIDGKNIIPNALEVENTVNKFTFKPNEVYALDIVLSTGNSKPKPSDGRATIYKRNPEIKTSLRLSSSTALVNEVNRKAGVFPFSLRSYNPKTALMGISECVQKGHIIAYPTMLTKSEEFVAQFKQTIAVQADGTPIILGGLPLVTECNTTKSVTNENYTTLLNTELKHQ